MLGNLSLGTVVLCFLAAAVMDYRTCQVYRLFWWIALIADVLLWINRADTLDYGGLPGLILFCLLQQFFFCKMYGRADCHGFCVGAITLFCMGGSLWDYLMLMLCAFLLLLAVQVFRRNINRQGNLKKPVAFIPYLTSAFLLYLWKI